MFKKDVLTNLLLELKPDMINRTLYCETYNLVKLKILIYTYIVSTENEICYDTDN